VELFDEILADRAPSSVRTARILLTVDRAPALIGKGRRKDAGIPKPRLPTRIQFHRPVAAKQAIDLLVGGGGAGKPRRESLHDGKGIIGGAFSRAAINRKARLVRRDRRDRPAYFQRAELADQLGRRIERASQIIGEKPQ
jgi:hypothetical protein